MLCLLKLKVHEYKKVTGEPTGHSFSVVIVVVDVNDPAPHFSCMLCENICPYMCVCIQVLWWAK